jgi:hypothetical protein
VQTLVFRYPLPVLLVMCAGFPLLGGMGILFLLLPFLPMRRTQLSVGMKADVIFCAALGVLFIWICLIAVRCWRSYFSVYIVDASGINVRFFSSETTLRWDQLRDARYRKALGQIDLRFDGFPHLVVLNNVDMNRQRKTVQAALLLIESMLPGRLKRSFI